MRKNQARPCTVQQMLLRGRLLELVCSDPWREICQSALEQSTAFQSRRPGKYLEHAGIYPPGGRRRTRMVHCGSCGKRWYPPQYVPGDLCLDCAAGQDVPITDEHNHVSSTSSPTTIALRQMEMYHVRLIEPRLEAEDEPTLRRQIAEYSKYQTQKST